MREKRSGRPCRQNDRPRAPYDASKGILFKRIPRVGPFGAGLSISAVPTNRFIVREWIVLLNRQIGVDVFEQALHLTDGFKDIVMDRGHDFIGHDVLFRFISGEIEFNGLNLIGIHSPLFDGIERVAGEL